MEDQGVVVVKDSFLARITQAIKKFFFKGKTNELLLAEKNESRIKLIEANEEFIQKESEIAELTQVITYSSDSESVGYSFVKLAVLIKGSSLSHKEAEDISNEADYLNEMEWYYESKTV